MLQNLLSGHPIPQAYHLKVTMENLDKNVSRDPEDRKIDESDSSEKKEKMLDKTIADTFPASDPPSSLPDPDDDSFAA